MLNPQSCRFCRTQDALMEQPTAHLTKIMCIFSLAQDLNGRVHSVCMPDFTVCNDYSWSAASITSCLSVVLQRSACKDKYPFLSYSMKMRQETINSNAFSNALP